MSVAGGVLAAPVVTDFGPVGLQRERQQVRLRFSDDMVALGDNRAADPATVSCSDPAYRAVGHWIDARNWVGEFAWKLRDGVRCTVEPKSDVRSLAGAAVTMPRAWEFNSGGPSVKFLPLRTAGGLVRELQLTIFEPSVPVDPASLRHLACHVGTQAMPVRILEGAERYSAIERYTKAEGQQWAVTADWIAAECGTQPWPNNARVRWTWSKKIASRAGVDSQSDTTHELTVREPFAVGYLCKQLDGSEGCDPRQPVELTFRTGLAKDQARALVMRGSSGKEYGLVPEGCNEYRQHCKRYRLRGTPDEGETLRPVYPAGFADVDGRRLSASEARLPVIEFARLPMYLGMPEGRGALGWTPGGVAWWPLVARQTEAAIAVRASLVDSAPRSMPALLEMHRLARYGHLDVDRTGMRHQPFFFSKALFSRVDKAPARVRTLEVKPSGPATEFVGVPLSGYGSWVVEADSPRFRKVLGASPDKSNPEGYLVGTSLAFFHLGPWSEAGRVALVQLTNLKVHLRTSSAGNSLVWVTAADTGKPVAGVDVELWSCASKQLSQASTDAGGTVMLGRITRLSNCPRNADLWVVARHGEDIVVLPFVPGADYKPPLLSHTMVDRILLQPGETVSMQHLARLPSADGWSYPRPFKGKLKLFHNDYDKVHEQELAFDERGSAVSSWPVPAGARLGAYRAELRDPDGRQIGAANFQVEQFRRPLFDAHLSASAVWKDGRQSLDLSARLHFMSGGAAAGQAIVINGRYDGHAEAPVPGYDFGDAELHHYAAPQFAQQQALLDQDGQWQLGVPIAAPDRPSTLRAEMQFTDPNGEVQTRPARVSLWPMREKLGLRVGVADVPGVARVSAVLLDERNAPLAGREVVVDAFARGFNDFGTAGREREVVCTARTDEQGKASCTVPWTRSTHLPNWLFRARSAGAAPVSQEVYKDIFAWTVPKQALALVSTAPLQASKPVLLRVRAPFFPATVLLTVEREGVLASHVLPITAAEQEFALPTERAFAPGARLEARFVNATAVQQASLDLAFDQATHQLRVEVATARDTARPGQTVAASVKVWRADGQAAAGARVTVAAFDDALETLRPNLSWRVATAFWGQRQIPMASHDLSPGWTGRMLGPQRDYLSLIEQGASRLFGRRVVGHGSRRGSILSTVTEEVEPEPEERIIVSAPSPGPGGGREVPAGEEQGAAAAVRSDFSSLALWQTDVVLDDKGQAQISIPLKDSLTRWRIVAVAMDGSDQYGYGHTLIKTTKQIQVLSGLPQVVRAGDRLLQAVTVRNDSAAAVTLQLKAEAPQAPGQSLERSITLAANANQVVEFALAVPDGVPQLDWRIEARQADGDGDALHVTQRVLEPVPLTVRDSTIVQVEGSKSVHVAQPAGALPGKGGVAVEWKASLVDAALSGARAWMRAYPYACMEQISSKAAVSGDPLQWRAAMDRLSASLDHDGLARYYPGTEGSEVLTAYLLDLAQAYGLRIPAQAKASMEAALRRVLASDRHNDRVPKDGLLAYRLALQAAIAPNLGALNPVIPPDLSRLPTIALMDWVRYLLATPASPQRAAWLEAAAGALRGRYELRSTRLTWRGDRGMSAWWMMWTMNVASARMALLAQQWQQVDARWKDDAARLMLALVDTQRQGHWDTTTSNALAVAALQAFSRNAESVPVSGASRAQLGAAADEGRWPDPAPVLLPWSGADQLELRHSGSGAPWAAVTARAAMRQDAPVAHGVTVSKKIAAIQQRVPGKWSQGDVFKVTLALRSYGDNGWMVVDDPIPSGASILGKGMGGESAQAMQDGSTGDWGGGPSFEERGNDSYRAYYQWMGAYSRSVSYLVRLNNPGSFQFPATRVVAMYAPEIFAEVPNAPLEVGK